MFSQLFYIFKSNPAPFIDAILSAYTYKITDVLDLCRVNKEWNVFLQGCNYLWFKFRQYHFPANIIYKDRVDHRCTLKMEWRYKPWNFRNFKKIKKGPTWG
jgi:hypothetical protein